ncbi:xanthine dehydrogenase, Fe-S binding subunit [Nostocoides australiense Ben110]|uniref:Xanthine dehydrogenase, Fe-S binding subunit n=1 Tax=Nostocoides australiense Ben110 TaxID=1193182 RepID=W6JZA4_9MICO|nr:(2Fe-2S)-binding protein [Tetrasphaera australiensis]CCH74507.1 xanthine dehydrogenase, Fe-S binding subunit [Tetrasphaera australiensis Ben110]
MTSNSVTFSLNGVDRTVDVPGAETLLDTLRDRLNLRGSKEGCLEGECGACTVLVDDRPIDACIYPTAACGGRRVRTVEGLSDGGVPSLLQRAMVRSGSIQCGFCTPGFVVAVTALLERESNPSRADIADAVNGNICRCTGYAQIIEAVQAVVADSLAAGTGQEVEA